MDIICLKCLAKEPARRYATAEALANDLERWLSREPIHARPSTFWERALKWTRRHPARAGLVALALLAPAVIIALLLETNARVAEALETARRNEQRAHTARIAAEAAAARARTSERAAREQFNEADMTAAWKALEAGDYGTCRRLLVAHRPDTNAPGAEDFRGFEWHWLQRRVAGGQQFAFAGHAQAVLALAFSADGRRLFSSSDEALVRQWNPQTGAALGTMPEDRDWPGATWPARKFSMYPSSVEATLSVALDPSLGPPFDFAADPRQFNKVRVIACSPDGRWLATAADNQFVRFWDAARDEQVFMLPEVNGRVAFSPDSRFVALGAKHSEFDKVGGRTSIYDLETRRRVRVLPDSGGLVAWSGDGRRLATGHWPGKVKIWNPADGALLAEVPCPRGTAAGWCWRSGRATPPRCSRPPTASRWENCRWGRRA